MQCGKVRDLFHVHTSLPGLEFALGQDARLRIMGTMMDRAKALFLYSIFTLLLFNFSASSSLAALGGIEEGIVIDQTQIAGPHASRSTVSHDNYRMHEIKHSSLTVHEFVTTDGKVFAVTWVGPVHPDFSVLFGPYFKDFQTAREKAQNQLIRRRSGMMESGDFHIEYGGHMAAQRGRAWVKSIVPQGFDTNEIR
jgi:hypothetical protein